MADLNNQQQVPQQQQQPQVQSQPPAQPSVPAQPQVVQPQVAQQAPEFDYDKLANIIQGKQTVAEDTILKNYFKQQGLSKDQLDTAITAFKQQQAQNQPDVGALQANNQKYVEQLRETQVINKAMLLTTELGIDIKTVPHIAKLADLSAVFGEDGTINDDKLKESINKVLEDVPGFKTAGTNDQSKPGFQQIGGSGQQQTGNQEDLLKGIFGIKK